MPYQAIMPMLAKWFTTARKPYTAPTREPEWEKGSQIKTCEPLSLLVAGEGFEPSTFRVMSMEKLMHMYSIR